ncbi:MAG: hypothetical protein PUD87_07585 [Prevotellaceae bacterium]|nr:hypothetical protein [Prevotellaceae bacterium]
MNNGIQTNKSEYHKETLAAEIKKSCLAKVIMLVAVMLLLMLSAKLTIPSDEQMMYGTLDGVCQCIQDSHGVPGDKSDDIVRNGIATVSHETDSAKKDTILADFKKFNRVEIYHHTFFSTAYIISNFNSRGARAAVGIFGLVIPTVNFNDFVLRNGPIRKEYNQRIIKQTITSDTYMGDNPDLGNTYNTFEGGGSID